MKLLEPIFIIGKRMEDVKGYYFTLLSPEESATVTPILEDLMVKRANENKFLEPVGSSASSSRRNSGGSKQKSSSQSRGESSGDKTSSSSKVTAR